MSSFNQRGCFGYGVYFVDGVLASGVEIILEMDFVRYAIQELEIHSFMIQIRILSMILQTFSTTLHNPSSSHTHLLLVLILPYDDDDDDEESTIHSNEIISQIPPFIAITLVLPTMEPDNSLIIGDDDLRTIPEKELDKFIKSSVEDLVPIPMESEDTTNSDKECDLPFCGRKFQNLFEPLFEFDDNYISNNVNPLFNEVLEDIESKDSYVSNFDEPALLVTPFSDANEDECFDPGGEIDEIDAFLDMDIFTDIENGYHDLKGDIIYLESLLIDDTIPNLPPEVFLDHDPKNLKDEPDNEDLKSMDCPDYEDSRARGFVHRSLELLSFACLYMGIRYPRSY
ncbi:hypothetical protein Tco_0948805 [Tanacetum coccineum]